MPRPAVPARVLEVGYERLPWLHLHEVEVVLQVVTRRSEHCAEMIGAGYTLAFG